MSVIYDQLRISDDGKFMLIDAHVNKASFFDDVYLKKITICTEDQVSEMNPYIFGSDYVYQQEIAPLLYPEPVFEDVQVLSADKMRDSQDSNGGWSVSYTPIDNAEKYYLSLVFSGKYSQFDTGNAPRLVVATSNFDPETDYPNSCEVLFTVDGVPYEEKGHRVWMFKGKGEVTDYSTVRLYLYTQDSNNEYHFVQLGETGDDFNFLHFYWQVYAITQKLSMKELHLMLDCNSFNEKFNKLDMSHNLFFVYIECVGVPRPDTPCRLDEMTTLGVTFDYGVFFNQAMVYTKELADSCQVSKGFVDFILNMEALKLSVETEHYVPAIKYWNVLSQNLHSENNGVTKTCGCHG